jgi:hypothetical protein
MRRSRLTLGVVLAAASIMAGAHAQSQADKTGSGGIAVAGQEGESLLTHPLTLGAVVAAAIGIAVATASAESSAVLTSTGTITTTTTTTR